MSVGAVGTGTSTHHHGEILQGAIVHGGEPTPCLITMPARGIGSTARYTASDRLRGLEVVPQWKEKAARAARLALTAIGQPISGRLEIESTVATGVGLGSSTCDVIAAIRAVCAAYQVTLESVALAALAVQAETASDPVMFDRDVVLFAQRRGEILESFGSWIPAYTVLSIDTDAGTGGVDTLSLPARAYTGSELATFARLIDQVREAFDARSPRAIAAIATESATLNQRYLPLRGFADILDIADEFQASGVQISHSGTIAGILFDPRVAHGHGSFASRVAERVRSIGARPLGLFTSGSDRAPGD